MLSSLFPNKISPFARFVLTYPDEVFQASHPSSEIIESPVFQAIVKFKWRAFAHRRYLMMIFTNFIYFILFSLAVATHNKIIQILVLILGAIIILGIFRYVVILYLNGIYSKIRSSFFIFLSMGVAILPAASVLLDLIIEESRFKIILRASAIGILWIGGIESLVVFRRLGIIIIGKDFLKNFLLKILIIY